MANINKYDIMATVGFLGNTALVDKKLKSKLKKLKIEQLLEHGFYKEAISWAVFEKNTQLQNTIVVFFQNKNYTGSFEYLTREFGVQASVFDKIKKIKKV